MWAKGARFLDLAWQGGRLGPAPLSYATAPISNFTVRDQRKLARKMPFSRRGSTLASTVVNYCIPNVLQLNVEGLTASEISVILPLVFKNNSLIIITQETHCTTGDMLVYPTST